jgi:hypothetical protein
MPKAWLDFKEVKPLAGLKTPGYSNFAYSALA